MELNRLPAGTLAVLVDENSVVQTVGTIYGWGEDLHVDDKNPITGEYLYKIKNIARDSDPDAPEYIINEKEFAYWKDVVQFDEHLGYGLPNQQLYEIESIPEGIEAPYIQWLYNPTDGFTKNPDYIETPSYSIDPTIVKQIQDETIESLINEVSGSI